MKVILATDGYKPAVAARELLLSLGDPERLEVTVLSVSTFEIFVPERSDVVGDSLEDRREHAEQIAVSTADRLRTHGFRTAAEIREGGPARKTLELAGQLGADLIVVGAGRRSWLGNVILGSTSTRLLHEAPHSVLVVHPSKEGVSSPKKVVVAVDGSESSEVVVDRAAAFLAPADLAVEVVSVVSRDADLFLPIGDDVERRLGPGFADELYRSLRERGEACSAEAAERLTQAGFAASSKVVEGHPAEVLSEAAREADLIVVGSRQLGPVRRTLLGSVSDHLARVADATLVARAPVST